MKVQRIPKILRMRGILVATLQLLSLGKLSRWTNTLRKIRRAKIVDQMNSNRAQIPVTIKTKIAMIMIQKI